MSRKYYLLICVILSHVSFTYSQNSTARFLLWHPSARFMSMGGVGTALETNAFAVFL